MNQKNNRPLVDVLNIMGNAASSLALESQRKNPHFVSEQDASDLYMARAAVAGLIDERDRLARIVADHEKQICRMTEERAELIEAAHRADGDTRSGRPDISGLPETERAPFLRGWDAAMAAIYGSGLRAALAKADPASETGQGYAAALARAGGAA